jgi:hypothetical protein
MPRQTDRRGSPFAEDFQAGGDADLPGADYPVTQDDIDALIASPAASIGERRRLLESALADLDARAAMDQGRDLAPLAARLRDALDALDRRSAGDATPSAYGLDPDERRERPDEEQERRESEPPEERG